MKMLLVVAGADRLDALRRDLRELYAAGATRRAIPSPACPAPGGAAGLKKETES